MYSSTRRSLVRGIDALRKERLDVSESDLLGGSLLRRIDFTFGAQGNKVASARHLFGLADVQDEADGGKQDDKDGNDDGSDGASRVRALIVIFDALQISGSARKEVSAIIGAERVVVARVIPRVRMVRANRHLVQFPLVVRRVGSVEDVGVEFTKESCRGLAFVQASFLHEEALRAWLSLPHLSQWYSGPATL